jgi:uncharacterized membrane protein YhhN
MIPNILIILAAAMLLIGLLYFESRQKPNGLLPTKSALSLLFILTALIQIHPIPAYYHLLLAGLLFCLAGDVFLALRGEKMFLFGLVSFLLGHIFYIFAFYCVARFGFLTWAGASITLVVSAWIYIWLRPHLGSMNTPVLFYMIVISIMLVGAWSVLGDARMPWSGRIVVFVGAFSFYFSDLFVARDRFLKKEFLNRLVGLPMYYTGQFLLAFSVGLPR